MPAYAGYDSFTSSRGRSESIYYTAKEYDSADGDESDYGRGRAPPPPPPPPHIFEDTPPDTIFNRRYVDPWDMENYVYIRKHVLDPASETSEVSPSPAGEPIQSKFYYVPGELNGLGECLECGSSAEEPEFEPEYSESEVELVSQQQQRQLLLEASDGHNSAPTPRSVLVDGMELERERALGEEPEPSELEEGEEDEEEGFYTERYDTVMDEDSIGGEDELVYSSYTDLETSSTEQPSSCDSSMSALRLHTPGFGKSSRRPIVLPKPLPQLEFPGPPSYEYYEPASCCYMPLPPPPPPPPPPPHHLAMGNHFHHHPHHPHHHPLASPPSIAGTILSDHHNYYTLNDCLECARQEAEHVPLYATTSSGSPTRRRSRSVSVVSQSMSLARRPSQMLDPSTAVAIAATNANVCYTPQHFSLSKKGLLQIDYSCNWNNLDRYIAK